LLHRRALEKKDNPKLKKISIPKILLLDNKYQHSDLFKNIYKKCELNADILDFYHSIFILEPDGSGYFVHTKEKTWL